MQTPIPHNGPRGSPETDTRQAAPLIMMATAAVVPSGAITVSLFTVIATVADVLVSLRSLIAHPLISAKAEQPHSGDSDCIQLCILRKKRSPLPD
jgi:hypothetical protein